MEFAKKFIPLILVATLLFACSNEKKEPPEKGSIQAMTEEIGHEAAQTLQEPIDMANITVDQEDERIKKLEDQLDKLSE